MTAEIGLAALWMAAALCVMQFITGALALRADTVSEGADIGAITRPAAIVQGLLAMTAFVCLLWLFAITDLSVKLVASNSHSDKPLLYKITGAWGNHEGSMSLWIAVMALSGAAIGALEKRLPEKTIQAVLAAQGAVGAGFYAFIIGSSNPFERLPTPAAQGAGLNPLLQDFGLAFHPPTLYMGYVGLSVAFSFVVGALVTRQVTPDFARAMRPWVLGAWVFLTLGISAGSWWAYYELGWGGWWFWDPVENASLMPWLAATALLHSVTVLAARDALRTWTVMLGVVAFSMSMLGTFIVRSGVLTSVHSFAVDPERGAFILILLAIYIGGALALFAWRAGTISEGKRFALASREAALVFNNIMLCAILGVVLLGTLYPLMAEAMGDRVSVGAPYFNSVSAVFALPMFAIMAVGPILRWRQDSGGRISKAAILLAAIGIVTFVAGWLASDAGILPLLGLAFAAVLGVASVLPLYSRSLRRTPLATWGMVLAHLGIAVSLFGMASESGFSKETLAAVSAGESAAIGPYEVTLLGVEPLAGPNWTALEARLSVSDGSEPVVLRPQSRSYVQPVQTTTESALHNRWDGQLYVVLGQAAGDGRWQLRLWWKPFVTLIWYGSILIALGGAMAAVGHIMTGHRRRRLVVRLKERRAEEAALA